MMSTHDMFVAAAYVLSAIGIAGLIAWILADQQTQRRELAAFEARGVKPPLGARRKGRTDEHRGRAHERKPRLLVLLPLAAFARRSAAIFLPS